jgi:DNA-directed RNA polymerase specialized sigma24 family protein
MRRSGSKRSLAGISAMQTSGGRDNAQLMLVDQPEIRQQVRKLVRCLVEETSLHDDLCQDALLHLWQSEAKCPGQPIQWYLKGCWFCIQNLLKRGRSAHCLRHRAQLHALEEGCETNDSQPEIVLISPDEPTQHVCVRDVFATLSRLLGPMEQTIVGLLTQGYRVCEIAQRLRVSYTVVIRYRSRIAARAITIGFSPDIGFNPPIRMPQ